MYVLGYINYKAHQVIEKSKMPARALDALRNWRARRAAITEIEALPDRLLRDIGMNRGDINATVTALMGGRDAQAAAGTDTAGAPAGPFETACC